MKLQKKKIFKFKRKLLKAMLAGVVIVKDVASGAGGRGFDNQAGEI